MASASGNRFRFLSCLSFMSLIFLMMHQSNPTEATLLEVFGVSPMAGFAISGGLIATKLTFLSRFLKMIGFGRNGSTISDSIERKRTEVDGRHLAHERMFERLRAMQYQRNLLPRKSREKVIATPSDPFDDPGKSVELHEPQFTNNDKALSSTDSGSVHLTGLSQVKLSTSLKEEKHLNPSNSNDLFDETVPNSRSSSFLSAIIPGRVGEDIFLEGESESSTKTANLQKMIIINAPKSRFKPAISDNDIRLNDKLVLPQNFVNHPAYKNDQKAKMIESEEAAPPEQMAFGIPQMHLSNMNQTAKV